MVMEVVSDSSEKTDLDTLLALYFRAGIQEYWLVDVRKALRFDIFRRNAKGYSAARKTKWWIKSVVFGKSFMLNEDVGDDGNAEYALLVGSPGRFTESTVMHSN